METIFMPVHDIPVSAPPEPFQESRHGTETLNCELDEWNAGYGDEAAVAFPPKRDSGGEHDDDLEGRGAGLRFDVSLGEGRTAISSTAGID
jgi:hypothetical protein